MKKLVLLILMLVFTMGITSCGSSEFQTEEGSVQAVIVEYFTADGFDLTDIEGEEEEFSDGTMVCYEATAVIKTDRSDDEIKEYIYNHGFEGDWSAGWFKMAEGEADSKTYFVTKLKINDDLYEMVPFEVNDGLSDDGYPVSYTAFNVNKNGKLYLKNCDYEIYEKQQAEKKAEEEKARKESGEQANQSEIQKDELIVNTNGKSIYKVYCTGSITFSGTFTGSGNFIVKVLDSNQNLQELVCNEIGDYVLEHKTASVGSGIKYIQIECTSGNWNLSWTGTGGN